MASPSIQAAGHRARQALRPIPRLIATSRQIREAAKAENEKEAERRRERRSASPQRVVA